MITVDNNTKVHSRSSSPAFGNAMLQAVPSSEVYLMDCIQGMKHYPDKWFDLAIVDPPYGIGMDNQHKRTKPNRPNSYTNYKPIKYNISKWDNEVPTIEYFTELYRVSKQQVIWSANYFCQMIPNGKGWIY